MTQEMLLKKLERYEAALQEIAARVDEQTALEQHQARVGLPWQSIEFGRSDTYTKIAHLAAQALEGDSAPSAKAAAANESPGGPSNT